MSLRTKFAQTPLLLELIPPHIRARARVRKRLIDRFPRPAVDALPVDAFNIPEIVDENFRGDPFYRNRDPRDFAREVQATCGDRDCVVSKVVVHASGGEAELEAWAAQTREEYGIEDVVVVGAYLPDVEYPGPGVLAANRIFKAAGFTCGNIMIPERPGEAEKMLGKTEQGADFFTTQAILHGDRFVEVLEGYYARCAKGDLAPAAVLASFTPVSEQYDLDFLRFLGVDIPPATEQRLTAQGMDGMAAASIALAEENWRRIRETAQRHGGALGLNLEYISRHNFDPTLELGRRLLEA